MDQYLGQIIAVGFNFAPSGWAMCDGQLLPISQNAALFSLLGTTYGGDGQSTFALPDLRGRSPLGQGTGNGLTTHVTGQPGGTETVTLSAAQVAAHLHQVVTSTVAGTVLVPSATTILASQPNADFDVYGAAPGTTNLNPAAISPFPGGSQAHENRQPFNTVNYIIALAGIYPTQN